MLAASALVLACHLVFPPSGVGVGSVAYMGALSFKGLVVAKVPVIHLMSSCLSVWYGCGWCLQCALAIHEQLLMGMVQVLLCYLLLLLCPVY